MSRVFGFISNRPWLVLALLIAVTLLSIGSLVDLQTGEFRLEMDLSANRLLPAGDEHKKFYDFARKVFGSDETMLVAVHAEDVFSRENLERIGRLTERLAAVDGVHHVVSLTNALNVTGTEDGIDIRPFAAEMPDSPEAAREIRRAVLGNPVYAGNLVSKDGHTAALIIHFMDFSDREFIARGIDDRVAEISREEAGDSEIWLTGGPHVKAAQIRYTLSDLTRSLPLIVAVLALVLAFSFRTARGVVLPLLTVVMALIWTMAIAAWIGRSLNVVTVLIPPLLLILGLAYSVHVVSAYYDALRASPESGNREATQMALEHVWLPVALTGLTTAVGFAAIALSPLQAVAEFGVLSLVGVVATVVASLSAPPALLAVLPVPRRRGSVDGGPADGFSRFAERAAGFNLRRRRGILIASGLVAAIAALALTQLRVGADGIRGFAADAPVRRDFEAVNRQLEGANAFSVVLRSEHAGAFKEPETLNVVAAFQLWLESQAEIGGTSSLVEYMKLINRAFHADDPAYLAIPKSRRLASQLMFFGANEELDGFVDHRYQLSNIRVRANVIDTERVNDLVERIETRMLEFPEHLTGVVTGNPILINRLVDDIVWGQAYSLGLALVLIYGILSLMFLSFQTGLIALIPNVLPIAAYFGALGLTGVPLNPATSLIAPMALGIAIDDTIHYFTHFNREAKRLADERSATVTSLVAVGRPVTYTSIAICLGFLVLTMSDLRNYVQVGALGAFTLGFAWLVDFTLTPALCAGLRVVTLWDTLTLDLGHRPQESIPLFRGLSERQCRIAALMASLRPIPAGARLMSAGERGREMYVIIDGTLKIWVDGEAGPIELNRCSRGEVIGEVGFFYKARSANVDVIDDTRLLRLTQSNMERLAKRYPKIASVVLRNLNEIIAERLWKTTDRLS